MKRKLMTMVAISCCFGSLMAIGSIKTGDFDSALPSGNMEFFTCTGLNATGFRINDRYPNGYIPSSTYGAKLNLKVNRANAIGLALYANNNNATWELNTKHVVWHKSNRFLSIAPAMLYQQDTKNRGNYMDIRHDECQVWGGKIPLIYTIDTQRNLEISFSGALSCYWVSAKGYINDYHNQNYTEHIPYDYGTMPTVVGHLNCNLIATSDIWIVRPSIGFSFIDAHERGLQTEVNGGLSLGLPYRKHK